MSFALFLTQIFLLIGRERQENFRLSKISLEFLEDLNSIVVDRTSVDKKFQGSKNSLEFLVDSKP